MGQTEYHETKVKELSLFDRLAMLVSTVPRKPSKE